MDKVTDSGSVDAGSIPVRDTKQRPEDQLVFRPFLYEMQMQ